MSRTSLFGCLVGLWAAMLAGALNAAELVVVSWGGTYTRSQIEAYYKPFEAATNIRINSVDYNGDLSDIRAQVESGQGRWDVVDVDRTILDEGCEAGLFEPINVDDLARGADGSAPRDDFLPEAIHPCGVGQMIWGTVLAYGPSLAARDLKPESVAALFDLKTFPGKRGLRKGPKTNLEWALIADGVPMERVYEVLTTAQGIDRAFAKIDTIRNDVVWWEAGDQPRQMLTDGEVVMTSAYNGRVMQSDATQSFPVVWSGVAWEVDFWAIPKGTDSLHDALRFLKFATTAERMRDQTSHVPYWPARRSAASIGRGPQSYCADGCECKSTNACLKDCCESSDRVLYRDGFPVAAGFWTEYEMELTERFNAWLAR